MDLSTDLDFLSGALGSVSGIHLVPKHLSFPKLALESFHAKTLQWIKIPSLRPQTKTRSQDASVSAKKKSGQVEVFVKTLTGKTKTFYVYLDTEDVEGLKHKIEASENIPPCDQRLLYQGHQLEDDRMLTDYGIGPGIHIFQELIMSASYYRKHSSPGPEIEGWRIRNLFHRRQNPG